MTRFIVVASMLCASTAFADLEENVAGCNAGDADKCASAANSYIVAGDFVAAAPLLRKSCEAGKRCFVVQTADGLVEFGEGEPARALLALGCEKNDVHACMTLARWLRAGEAGKIDSARAATLFRAACDNKEPTVALQACPELARMLRYGDGVPRDVAEANALDAKANDALKQLDKNLEDMRRNPAMGVDKMISDCRSKGDPDRCFGALYFIIKDDIEEAITIQRKVCDAKPDICDWRGVADALAERGQAARGLTLMRDQCASGNPRSCVGLGVWMQEGKHVPKNLDEAQKLLERGCEAGDQPSCMILAMVFEERGKIDDAHAASRKGFELHRRLMRTWLSPSQKQHAKMLAEEKARKEEQARIAALVVPLDATLKEIADEIASQETSRILFDRLDDGTLSRLRSLDGGPSANVAVLSAEHLVNARAWQRRRIERQAALRQLVNELGLKK
jgi:uncharacterized protein